jgi:protein involved in polysaccharide export with SLBB domain
MFRRCIYRLILCFKAVLLGGIISACHSAPSPVVLPKDAEEAPDTTLGAGDVFDIRVYGEEALSQTFRVASDGSIDFPLLGTLVVVGLTPSEVSHQLETGLREQQYLKNPQVSIFVKEYKSKKVSVLGQVKKPGTLQYEDGMSIVEAIAAAGGFNSMARKNDTTVSRVIGGEKRRFHIPVKSIGEGRAANFILQPGDIVFVPERVF